MLSIIIQNIVTNRINVFAMVGIIGWPKLTEWPGGMVSPATDEMEVKLTYALANFSHKFIDITFYNGNELIADMLLRGTKQ